MAVSVIIPTCNRPWELAECLGRLAEAISRVPEQRVHVIVSDDGIAEGSRDLCLPDFMGVRWLRGPRRGPAANRNHGAANAQGEWLLFLDDDCLPEPDLLAAYSRAMTKRTCRVLEGRTVAVGVRDRVDMECPVNERGGYLWSCNMAIRRDLFAEMGGFDEGFPGPAMEDVDLRWRLLEHGEKIEFIPDAIVGHPWRTRKGYRHQRMVADSVAYFVTKHPEAKRDFTVQALALAMARSLGSHTPRAMRSAGARGLAREVALILYRQYALLRALHLGSRGTPR